MRALLLASVPGLCLAGCQRASDPNVLILLIDALRADHVGCYGYERPTTPTIDRLAERGVVFTDNTSPSSYTRASVPSIFTGVYPSVHGVVTQGREAEALSDEFTTLAETLKSRGYVTAAFMPNPSLKRVFNFDQGFDLYRDDLIPRKISTDPGVHETARKIHRRALEWLDRNVGRRFFLYLHYRDVHGPYVPPPPYDAMFVADLHGAARKLPKPPRYLHLPGAPAAVEHYVSQYDGEIRYVDDRIAELLKELEARGRLRNTLLVVTSDHGESFFEHGGWDHGTGVYQEEIHAPLIVVFPHSRFAGRRVDTPVQTLDVYPTILELLGLSVPSEVQGRSLLDAVEGSAPPRAVFSEGRMKWGRGHHTAVRVGSWKLIVGGRGNRRELYDLDRDPGEKRNVADREPERLRELLGELAAFHARNAPLQPRFTAGRRTLGQKTLDELRALGYVQ